VLHGNINIGNLRIYNFCLCFCLCFGTDGSILMCTPVTHSRLVVSSQISERAVMIRAPMAIAEFTIRSFAPGAAGAWYTTFMDAETPAQRAAARNTRVVHASIKKAAQPPCRLPSGLSMSAVTVTSQTTRASVLLDSSLFGTIDASVMTSRSPMDAPKTFGRAMISCTTVSSICFTFGGRLPLMRLTSGEEAFILSKGSTMITTDSLWEVGGFERRVFES